MGNLLGRQQSQTKQEHENLRQTLNKQKFVFDIHRIVNIKTIQIRNQYNILTPHIGQGAYGKVFKANHKVSKIIRSIKTVRARSSKQLLEEYQILRSLDHPNILKLYEIFIEGQNYSLVTDYYEGGSLKCKIANYSKLSEYTAAKYMEQILMALAYMNKQGFMHCDLKPQNILLDRTHRIVKVIDFGISRRIDNNNCKERGVGTLQYFAPQIVQGVILPKSDIWSCGVILLYMLTGRIPSQSQLHQGKFQLDKDFSYLLSNQVKNLIFRMVSLDYQKRPSPQEALNHDWFLIQRQQRDPKLDIEIQKCLCNMKLQCLFLSIIANFVLSQDDKLKPTEVFIECDKDKNGVISISELKSAISSICPRKYKSMSIEKVFAQLDKNQSKQIDLREFLACSIDASIIFQDHYIHQIFVEIDTNKDDIVSIQEFEQYIDALVPDHGVQQQLINQLDIDRDGQIKLSGFIQVLKQVKQYQ